MTPAEVTVNYGATVERVRHRGGYAWSVQAVLKHPDGLKRRVEVARRSNRAAAEHYALEVIAAWCAAAREADASAGRPHRDPSEVTP